MSKLKEQLPTASKPRRNLFGRIFREGTKKAQKNTPTRTIFERALDAAKRRNEAILVMHPTTTLSVEGKAFTLRPRGEKEKKFVAIINRIRRKRDQSTQSDFAPIKAMMEVRKAKIAIGARFKPGTVVPVTAAGTIDISTSPRIPSATEAKYRVLTIEGSRASAETLTTL